MRTYSAKLKRALALMLAFVMTVSVITVAPSTTAEAAAKKVVKSLTGVSKTKTLEVGKSTTIKAKVNATKKISKSDLQVTVKSSNKSVATVKVSKKPTKKAKSGINQIVVEGKKAGTATITVTTKATNKKNKKVSKKMKVEVVDSTPVPVPVPGEVTDINVSINSDTINIGSTAVISASVVPADATDKTLTYTSSNPAVASVTQTGVVTGISAGQADITVAAKNGVKKTIKVTVKAIGVTAIELDRTTATVTITGTVQLKATIKPETATNKNVKWTSENENVATVVNGLVTGIAAGTTKIIASTEDGSFRASCDVTVTPREVLADGVSLEMTNPYKDNTGREYANTQLVGDDITVRARVVNGNEPQGNKTVTLTLEKVYGNAPYCFEVRESTVQTDANGYANFVIGLKDNYVDEYHTATGGYYQSFLATAKESSSNKEAKITVKFAYIDLNGVVVENNVDPTLADIVPSTNASPSEDGIYTTFSIDSEAYENESKPEQYVVSQQTSSFEDDHKVYLSAAPYLVLPASKENDRIGNWEQSVNNGNGFTSAPCSVYNDATNETTTVQIMNVPAGLQYLTAHFNKIKLSKYTKINIDVIETATGESIGHTEITSVSNKDDLSKVQVERKKDVECYVVVSLISQGQVDVANEGYVLTKLAGEWATKDEELSEEVELLDTVTWTNVTKEAGPDKIEVLSYADAQKYLPEGEFLNASYEYTYEVPAFPYTGDAIITVKDQNESLKAYFLYPTVNNGNNKNVLVTPDDNQGRYAIQATGDEVTKLTGTLTTDGNIAIVDAQSVGRTNLRADIQVAGLEEKELNSQNGGVLYTSVQWAPVPNKNEEVDNPDYFAIEGQYVNVIAQLYDKNGDKKSDSGKTITFKYKKATKDVKISGQGQKLCGDANGVNEVSVTNFEPETDTNGQAKLQLLGKDIGYVEGLTASDESGEYNVKLIIADKPETVADIYWVDLGLTFVDSAVDRDEPVRTTQFANSEKNILKRSSSVVGKTWDIGYQVVAQSYKFDYTSPELVDRSSLMNENHEFVSVKNVALNYSKADNGAETTQTNSNNVSRITSEKIGSVTITGFFDTEKTVSNHVVFSFRNDDGDVVEYKNVGTGTPAWNTTKLKLDFDWTISGKNVELFAPNGNNIHVSTDTVVYVRVTDEYDNPVQDALVEYTITGVNADTYAADTQKTDAKGMFKINLKAPGDKVSEANASSTITVTVDKNKELKKSIVITYNTQKDVPAFGIWTDTDKVKAVKMLNSKQMVVFFTNTVDAKSIQKGEFIFTQIGATKKYLVTEAVKGSDDNSVVLTVSQDITDLTSNFSIEVKSYTDEKTDITYDLIDTYGQKLTGTTTYTFKPSERGLEQ